MPSVTSRLATFAVWALIPYLLGCVVTKFLTEGSLDSLLTPLLTQVAANLTDRDLGNESSSNIQEDEMNYSEVCEQRFYHLMGISKDENPFDGISLQMHRNGEAEACGEAISDRGFLKELMHNYVNFSAEGKSCLAVLNKFDVEALLTMTVQSMLNSCSSAEEHGHKEAGFLGFCDMGPSYTPILLDHNSLVHVQKPDGTTSLPCRFHNREGLRITQLGQLTDLVREPSTMPTQKECESNANGDETCSATTLFQRHLFAVPAGRVFMFAPSFVGEIFHLPHVEGSDNKQIYLEAMSISPRVFDVFNFFSREESEELVQKAIAETSDSHKIKRSSTGASGYNLNSRRTSESGFDTHGETAVKVKKRCFNALGFDEYLDSHGDGLQILRYNVSKAYNSHLDWIEDQSGQLEHDFQSGGAGGNRFATILMYMSDLGPEDGGETVFPRGWPPNVDPTDRISTSQAIENLRASDYGNVLQHGSWEESLVAKCRTRLAVRPHSSRAVLFYSQHPNGTVDQMSLHGACPVLSGQKYAANLWVWNTPRQGFPGAPVKEEFRNKYNNDATSSPANDFKQIHARFKNTGNDASMKEAELFFEDNFWGKLGHNDQTLAVNTYRGHLWNVKVEGKVVKSWTISEEDGLEQELTI